MGDKTAPKAQLQLEWIYGYRGHQCRSNVWLNSSREVVYFVAGVGVVYNIKDQRQRFYRHHDDDILSLALHPEKSLVATGQIGKDPYICIWDTGSLQTESILKGGHTNGVTAVSFDKDGKRLVSVGLDSHATICVWDWKRAKILATARGHSDRVFDVQFHPYQENVLVSCGVKHIKFWTLCGNSLKDKRGIFGDKGEVQTILCLGFGPNSTTYAGTLGGDVYVFQENQLQKALNDVHTGGVICMQTNDEGFATGGQDGEVKLWDPEMKPITKTSLVSCPHGYSGLSIRAVCWRGEQIVAGTAAGEIFEIQVSNRKHPRPIMQGHAPGELWGLAIHPRKPIFASASDDGTLRIWNHSTRDLMARTSLDAEARSCAFSDDGSQLAVGLKDGSFVVYRAHDLSEVTKIKDRKEVLHEMKYSPDGQYLAVGSNDNFVDVYATQDKYKRIGQCTGNSSFITHLDWSEDSKYIQTNSGAGERLYYKIPNCKQVTAREEVRAIRWYSWTGVLGPEVEGIWEKYTDKSDVNSADANFTAECVVTGDDFGMVKLMRFPCLKKGAKFRKYVGHSAHVTNVRFTHDQNRVISAGGADHALFQWQFSAAGGFPESGADGAVDSGAFVDSDSEASDSDMSDVGALDSDVETERQQCYDRAVYKEDTSILAKSMKDEMSPGQKRTGPPQHSLKLQFVHGYRGYDCRNNVFFTQRGEVVSHVAAVAYVYDREKHTQRHYTQHTDDILCLSIHPRADIVATGQVGRDPAINVWDIESMETLSVLKGQHQRGVCAVDFSGDGKKLASVGLDDNHTIVVWDWKRGEKLASTRGGKGKIFVAKWNPHNPDALVTVGDKHIRFWIQTGGGFTSSRGTFGSVGKVDTMMCVVFGASEEHCFTGGASGDVYVWSGNKLIRKVKAHDGPVFAMHALDRGFVTGGKDGVVALWDEQIDKNLKTYSIKRSQLAPGSRGTLIQDNPPVRAVVLGLGKILAGTKSGEIIEIDKSGPMTVLLQGHGEGELWGLATHPTKSLCATVGQDKTLRIWELGDDHKMTSFRKLKQAGCSVGYSPDGKALAVGLKDGSFTVVNSDTLDDIMGFHHRKEEISDIKFSPEPGKYLAVASHDNFVDIYSVINSKRVGVCKGASSYVTHIDWDVHGKLLQVNTGSREQLFFEAPRGKRQALRNATIESHPWESWTCVLGSTMTGVWPPKSDVTDVNAAARSKDRALVATADDFGFVKLFNYPSTGKFSKFKKYSGHSAHVTNIRWTADDRKLASTGGADTSLLVWQRVGVSASGDSDDDGTDDEEEGYDSDVAREKNMDYGLKIYAAPIRETAGVRPDQQTHKQEEKAAVSRSIPEKPKVLQQQHAAAGKKKSPLKEVNSLKLEYVFGYRGFDCRNNLYYLPDSSDIVYHTAGAAIVHNLQSNAQSFYLEHNDDILCLAVNRSVKFSGLVATGQLGTSPSVHVWEASVRQPISVIQGVHQKGVCALSFSSSGKLLASIGLEDSPRLAVTRWKEGSEAASVEAHNSRLFVVEFRPDSDTHLVTVGVKHVKFWTLAGSQLLGKRGHLSAVSGNGKPPQMQTFLSVAFGPENTTFTGAMNGDVYVWHDEKLARIVSRAHGGPVFSMHTSLKDGFIVTGAKEPTGEGSVRLWDAQMQRCKSFSLSRKASCIKSVHRAKGRLLVGTKDCDVWEINEKTGHVTAIARTHREGEVWGLSTHATKDLAATASDDGTVRLWDLNSKTLVGHADVGPARSVSYNPEGTFLAVGLKSGEVLIVASDSLKELARRRDRGQPIADIKFSNDGKLLAAGSESKHVDFYNVAANGSLSKAGFCRGLQGMPTQIDFCDHGKFVRVSTTAYVPQVFEVPSGKPLTDDTLISKITWASWTSVLGQEVIGVWPKNAQSADVNCACVSHAGNAIVTGDDFGLVKLFRFPATEKYGPYEAYHGHSAHVTNVRFTSDDRRLVSTGGDDCSVFVWRSQ